MPPSSGHSIESDNNAFHISKGPFRQPVVTTLKRDSQVPRRSWWPTESNNNAFRISKSPVQQSFIHGPRAVTLAEIFKTTRQSFYFFVANTTEG